MRCRTSKPAAAGPLSTAACHLLLLLLQQPVCGKSGTVHANECVAKCLDRPAFKCQDSWGEEGCKTRCAAAAFRKRRWD